CAYLLFFFQAEDGIRDFHVTGVQTCALPIYWSDPDDFSSFYSALNRLKKEQKALQAPGRSGEMSGIGNDRPQSVWSFRRTNEGRSEERRVGKEWRRRGTRRT